MRGDRNYDKILRLLTLLNNEEIPEMRDIEFMKEIKGKGKGIPIDKELVNLKGKRISKGFGGIIYDIGDNKILKTTD